MARAAKAAANKGDVIQIPSPNLLRIQVRVIGDSPLVCHKWSQKALEQMRNKQQGKAQNKKEAKDPAAEFNGARYRLADGLDGLPVMAMKRALIDAGSFVEGITKVGIRGALHVNRGDVLVPIELPDGGHYGGPAGNNEPAVVLALDSEMVFSGEGVGDAEGNQAMVLPAMREDPVRLQGSTADLRYRPYYWPWAATFDIVFNSGVLTTEQVVNLCNQAGFSVGLCEHRPQKNGQWGMFHVEGANEVQVAA